MRGVIALAAALSLPETLANGAPFPERNLIIFLTFSVILVTLVLQGLTLPSLIRALGLAGSAGLDSEQKEARRMMLETALKHIELQLGDGSREETDPLHLYEDLAMHYRRRLAGITGTTVSEGNIEATARARAAGLSRELIRIERQTAVRLRDEGMINDEALRHLERELDLSETRLDVMPYH
jgi:monovalent cation/hydrogen antiporter